ncbi:hypothetical protein Gotur_027206 [Gossypium turneri]
MRNNSMVRQPLPHVAHPAVPPLAPPPPVTCLVETPPLPTTELSQRIPVDKSEGLLPIHRWTSIGRTQDEKTLKKLQNSAGRVGSSTDTTLGSTDTIRTSIGRTHCSKQCSFGLGLLSIILFGLLIP